MWNVVNERKSCISETFHDFFYVTCFVWRQYYVNANKHHRCIRKQPSFALGVKLRVCHGYFAEFCFPLWPAAKIISMTIPAHGGKRKLSPSVRLLPTKNPACSCNCPWCQFHSISFGRFPRPWQTVGPITGLLFCSSDAYRKRTSTIRARRKPLRPSWSGISLCLSHVLSGMWLYCIAPKIIETLKPYHDTVGRDAKDPITTIR